MIALFLSEKNLYHKRHIGPIRSAYKAAFGFTHIVRATVFVAMVPDCAYAEAVSSLCPASDA